MPNSLAGYTPRFHMPIIDSSQDYAAIKIANVVTSSPENHYALRITVTDTTYNRLFSMVGSIVYFVPENAFSDPLLLFQSYPDLPPLSPGTGFLAQVVWPTDFSKLTKVLPVGVPPPTQIVYLNVVPTSVHDALKPFVEPLPDKWLTDDPSAGDHEQHVEEFLAKVLEGKAGVFVPGGQKIGKIATTEFTLFLASSDFNGLSPILHIRDMPNYGGEQWSGHPLIESVSTLPVPVNVYAEFKVWDDSDKAFKPLPSGVTVRLMDFDPEPQDELLQSITTDENSNGKTHFTFPDIQTIDESEPDLFFEVDLGNHNPDPAVLVVSMVFVRVDFLRVLQHGIRLFQ